MTYQDQYYQDASGGLHFLSAEDHINAVQNGFPLPDPAWTPISNEAAEVIQNPPLSSKDAHNNPIIAQIDALEATVTQRRIREAIAGTDNEWLATLNTLTVNLRSQLQK